MAVTITSAPVVSTSSSFSWRIRCRHGGLERAVEARRAAADVRVPHLDQLDARHGPDEVTRLLANALGVREMACIPDR